MSPTLRDGQMVLVKRGPVRIDDIALLRHPQDPGTWLVKRVVDRTSAGVVVVGDNPQHSTDSRHFGPVPAGLVHGRVTCSLL